MPGWNIEADCGRTGSVLVFCGRLLSGPLLVATNRSFVVGPLTQGVFLLLLPLLPIHWTGERLRGGG